MSTVILSVTLLVAGLALSFFSSEAIEFVSALDLPQNIQDIVLSLASEQTAAWAALAASPILLIIASLIPNL
jgi:hypothetical protein